MKKPNHTLALSKETLRSLDSREIRQAAAAVGSGRYTFCAGCTTACG
jgi:hypothetical protein